MDETFQGYPSGASKLAETFPKYSFSECVLIKKANLPNNLN